MLTPDNFSDALRVMGFAMKRNLYGNDGFRPISFF